MSTLTPIAESAARFPGDLAHIRRFNLALATAVSRTGSELAWEQSGRGWGTLRTAQGAHVAYAANELAALVSL